MTSRDLLLPFLGQRSYLQLTTIFAALLPYLQGGSDVSLRISKPLLSNRVALIRADAAAEAPIGACVDCWWTDQAGGGKIFLIENGSPAQDFRIPYPEELVIAGWQRDADGAAVDGKSPYTTIERLVSLNKAYLSQLHPLSDFRAISCDSPGPVVALRRSRTDWSERNPNDWAAHHVSRVFLDHRDAGALYFARQPRRILSADRH